MTKEEMDRQIVEKKLAQLSVADGNAILNSFDAHGICIPANIGSTADKLLQLNLVKKITTLPVVSSLGYFLQLNNFGQLVKKKLELKCPF